MDEELSRLQTHLDEVERVLSSGGAIGKRLDFLMQELNREANTIGSKSNYAAMQKLVVQMKDELEKIKEQSLNVL